MNTKNLLNLLLYAAMACARCMIKNDEAAIEEIIKDTQQMLNKHRPPKNFIPFSSLRKYHEN